MLASIKNYLAHQARKPSGWFGRIVAPRVFNHENKQMEQFGLELMKPDEDDRILEIGFGNGRLISEIMPRVEDGKVCGIDISDEMIALASKRNEKWISNGNLEIQKASVENIPYPDDHFDSVFTCNTIYFWPDPLPNINEVKRVLTTGGTFYCAMRLKQQMESFNSVVRENKGVFKNLYQKHEVQQLFRDAGFRNVELHSRSVDSENLYVAKGSK